MTESIKPECTLVLVPPTYAQKVVRSLRYDGEYLVLEIEGADDSTARVVFRHPAGFRVLDERDLCEFWPAHSEPKGWLWEVHSNGWMDLERRRPLFNSHDFLAPLREFFVTDNMCISVFVRTSAGDHGRLNASTAQEMVWYRVQAPSGMQEAK